VFRGKEGERLSLMNKLAAGQSEVVEEGGYILVTLVNLVPDAGELPGIQVVGNQGGLAASGRSRQPECRALQGLVEPAEEALAGQHRRQERPRDFGKRIGHS